jgi:hypothetical protein
LTGSTGSTGSTGGPEAPTDLTVVVVHLFKGPLYRDTHESQWASLLRLRNHVGDYVGVLGLQVVVDESEGYAFLRRRPTDPDAEQIPRLVVRHSLSFHVSLLLALLRRRLAEFDATSTDARLVLSRDQIVEMLRTFLAASTNEAKLVDKIDTHINKVAELGYLRRLRGGDDLYEVRRILKAFVDGQWLADFDTRLDEYLAELGR